MAFTFKLGNPTDKVGLNVCRVPEWLEEHLTQVSSDFDEKELGNVDISLIKEEPFGERGDHHNHEVRLLQENIRRFIQEYYNYHNQPSGSYEHTMEMNLTSDSANGHPEAEETFKREEKEDTNDQEVHERAIHPKIFSDYLYMRLISLLYAVPHEQQA